MRNVRHDAERSPGEQRAFVRRLVEPEDAHGGEVEAVEYGCTGSEVVHALCEHKVSCVEHGAPEPGHDAEHAKKAVVRDEGVATWEFTTDGAEAGVVGVTVDDGEEDAEGLLDAEETLEGPFSVELLDRTAAGEAFRGYGALAGVVAFLGASPEEETEVKGERGGVRVTVLGNAGLGR